MSDRDIPGRLRIWADGLEILKSHSQALMAREAADEIERLRKERDEAEPLLNELWDRRTEVTEMRDEIKRLRRGGCARDQTVTQFCGEAAYLADQLQTSRERNRELIMRNGELEAEARNLRALLYERLP